MKKQESRHQFELQQLREKLQEQEKKFNQEQEVNFIEISLNNIQKWKIQVEESKRANADLMQQLDSLQLEESPAWILRKTAIKLIGMRNFSEISPIQVPNLTASNFSLTLQTAKSCQIYWNSQNQLTYLESLFPPLLH